MLDWLRNAFSRMPGEGSQPSASSGTGPAARAIALHEAGVWEDAVHSLRPLAEGSPGDPDLHFRLGDALYQLDRLDEALVALRQAISLADAKAEYHYKLGNILKDLDRPGEALACYRRALELDPRHAMALNNAGTLLETQDQPEEALDCYRRAVLADAGLVPARGNLAVLLDRLERQPEATAACQALLELRPQSTGDWRQLGNAHYALERYDDAIRSYREALAGAPRDAEALAQLGRALEALGRHQEALASFDAVLAIDPLYPYAAGMAAGCAAHICDWRGRRERVQRLVEGVQAGEPVAAPFSFFSMSADPAAQLACATAYTRRQHGAGLPPPRRGDRRHDRVRVAYVSADFHNHPVAWLLAELIERHDRARFEIIGASFGRSIEGSMRARLTAGFDRFFDFGSRPDAEIAAALREAEVDIAVDLMGYTTQSRPGVFARRPAPVQVSYLGFPATAGADWIDYILADRFVIPEELHGCYSENVVYLPDTFQVNDTTHRPAERIPTRAEAGLPGQGFVFCCFNNTYKLSPEFFDVWMRLLRRVEGSVLWLLTQDPVAMGNLGREARARGVAPERLVFAPRVSPRENLARYALADLFLDTLPINAGTTASDALWAGLPVLTCPSQAFLGRIAGSLLRAIDLPELIARTGQEYESMAIDLASRPAFLGGLRKKLAANRLTTPLFDIDRFRRHIESAYRTMWEIQQRGETPRPFSVEAVAGRKG